LRAVEGDDTYLIFLLDENRFKSHWRSSFT
jgi:hypothetical protein